MCVCVCVQGRATNVTNSGEIDDEDLEDNMLETGTTAAPIVHPREAQHAKLTSDRPFSCWFGQ